jgi:hypothetical protein
MQNKAKIKQHSTYGQKTGLNPVYVKRDATKSRGGVKTPPLDTKSKTS